VLGSCTVATVSELNSVLLYILTRAWSVTLNLQAPSNLMNTGMVNSLVKAAPLNRVDASLQDLPLGWCNGGPGGLAPPSHGSVSAHLTL
jgi:hypothetical protein